jgi:hypothetical protein
LLSKIKDAQAGKDDWLFPFLKLLENIFHSMLEKAIAK